MCLTNFTSFIIFTLLGLYDKYSHRIKKMENKDLDKVGLSCAYKLTIVVVAYNTSILTFVIFADIFYKIVSGTGCPKKRGFSECCSVCSTAQLMLNLELSFINLCKNRDSYVCAKYRTFSKRYQ